MDRRLPVYLSGLRAYALARLEARAHHSARHHSHARISASEPVGAGGAPMKPVKTDVAFATPWFQVLAKTFKEGEPPYYTLRIPDYSSILARTAGGRIVIVRQFRPAV